MLKIIRIKLFWLLIILINSSSGAQDTTAVAKNVQPDTLLPRIEVLTFKNRTVAGIPFQIETQKTYREFFPEDFSDWMKKLTGVYILDPAACGQPTYYTFQGLNPRQSRILLDHRPFYDFISGKADLTLLPMNFFEYLAESQLRDDQLIFLRPMDFSAGTESYYGSKPYTQIFHHKAAQGFSDVDFRFGQQVHRRAKVMVGGDIKSNDGYKQAYIYEHQNLRAKIDYIFSRSWSAQYSILNHRLERNLPGYFSDEVFASPNAREKLTRTDHTFNFYGKILGSKEENFRLNLYYSTQNSKLSDSDSDERWKNDSHYEGTNFLLRLMGEPYHIDLSGMFEHGVAVTTQFGKKSLYKSEFILSQNLTPAKKWTTSLDLGLTYQNEFDPQFYAGLFENFHPDSSWQISMGANRRARFPSLGEFYGEIPVSGNEGLSCEVITEISGKIVFRNLFVLNSYVRKIDREIRAVASDTNGYLFANENSYAYAGLDFGTRYEFSSNWLAEAKGIFLKNHKTANLPNMALSAAIQFSHTYFEGDLDALIRFSGEIYGERDGKVFHTSKPLLHQRHLDSAINLNLLANLKFGNLQFYFWFENLLDADYELIPGYPMNGRTFHYGIRWDFWD